MTEFDKCRRGVFVNAGVLGKKFPADSTLRKCTKEELIQMLKIAENNYNSLSEFYHNACEYSKKLLNELRGAE